MGDKALEQSLGAVLQWMVYTNRVAIPRLQEHDPPMANPGDEGDESFASRTRSELPLTARDSAALSRRFLSEWRREGYPGRALPQPVHEQRSSTVPSKRAAGAVASDRPFPKVATHSLYNRSGPSKNGTAPDAVVPPTTPAREKGGGKRPRVSSTPESARVVEPDMDACEMQGCDQTARFGLQSSILPIRCGRHRGEGMVERAKRRKACDSCTSRKIRCDGAQPACGPCSVRQGTCRYSTRLKSGPKRGTTIESTPKRTGPTEIAPAPGPLFSGSPLAAGGSVSAATTAAAAAAAFSSPFSPPPPASPLAATISPMASTPATASATSNGATPVPGITTGDPFMGGSGVLGSGLETSPRALAAHALTGFKFTKDMPGAAGVGGGPPIWPACLGGVNTERGEEQHRMGGQAGNNGVSEASAVGGAATDVGGLPSLSMAQLGATSSFHLAMLGMLPAFNALLGSLPPGLQMPQLQPAAGGLQAAPEAPTPSQQQKAGELPVLQPAPFIHAPLLALPKPASDHQQQAKPGQMGPRNAMTMLPATTPTTGVGPAVISEPAAMYNEHPSPAPAQEAPTTLVAIAPAVVHDSTLGPPIAPAPPPVKQPSQGLNLLAMSQELQGGQGGGGLSRAAPGVTAAPTPPIIGSPERGQAGDSSAVAENSIPGISRFRGPSLSRTQSKLRRSCDRCTMRKIRCDGSGIICKRCEVDGQACHYSLKSKSGPKPQPTRNATPSPVSAGQGRSLPQLAMLPYRMHNLPPSPVGTSSPAARNSWQPVAPTTSFPPPPPRPTTPPAAPTPPTAEASSSPPPPRPAASPPPAVEGVAATGAVPWEDLEREREAAAAVAAVAERTAAAAVAAEKAAAAEADAEAAADAAADAAAEAAAEAAAAVQVAATAPVIALDEVDEGGKAPGGGEEVVGFPGGDERTVVAAASEGCAGDAGAGGDLSRGGHEGVVVAAALDAAAPAATAAAIEAASEVLAVARPKEIVL